MHLRAGAACCSICARLQVHRRELAQVHSKPFPFRSPEGRVALVIEVEKARYTKLPFEHTRPISLASPLCSALLVLGRPRGLVFNVEVNLRCGAVLGYLLAVQFHL